MSTTNYGMDDHERLVAALVARWPRAQEMLRTSPTFRHSVNELARMLPSMIAGLARESEGVDRMIAERVRVAKSMPPPPMLLDKSETAGVLRPTPAGPTVAERAAEMVCEGSYQPFPDTITTHAACPECAAPVTVDEHGFIPAHPSTP